MAAIRTAKAATLMIEKKGFIDHPRYAF